MSSTTAVTVENGPSSDAVDATPPSSADATAIDPEAAAVTEQIAVDELPAAAPSPPVGAAATFVAGEADL